MKGEILVGNERDTSGFALSIGTGLSMETLFNTVEPAYDPTRVFDKYSLKTTNELIVSWYTIIRNIVSSFNHKDKNRVLSGMVTKDVASIANSEIEVILMLCVTNNIKLSVLAPTYKSTKQLPFVDTSTPTMKNVVYVIAANTIGEIKHNNIIYDSYSKFDKGSILFSHISMDLLRVRKRDTVLLESNTGKILQYTSFNRKYRKNAVDTSYIPMNDILLSVFGDSSGLLRTHSITIKRSVGEMLARARVTPNSSRDRIVNILAEHENGKKVLIPFFN